MIKRLLLFTVFQLIFGNAVLAGLSLIPAPPKIQASGWLIMDYHSGQILASENIDEKLPPASLTKIMTTYIVGSELAGNKINLDDTVVVSEKAWRMPGSRMFIEVNDEVSVDQLVKGVVIQSGNDASVALAEYISGNETVFAELMNQHAKRLDMKDSHFMNSTGLPDENHYITAHDVAILAAALIRDFPDVYKYHSDKSFTYNEISQQNRNRLLWLDDSVDGIKTGHTEAAGYCLVASAMRNDMRLITVVMGTDSDSARTKATQALLNYGFRFYETRKLYVADDPVTTARVWKGKEDSLDLVLQNDLYITLPRGQFDKLNTSFNIPDRLFAPIEEGKQIGEMVLSLADEMKRSEPVYAMRAIPEGSLFSRLKDDIRLIFE